MLCFDLACPEVETLFVFVYHISHFHNGSIKVYFPEGMPTRKLATRKMLLSEFDIVYVTQKAIKAQTLADHFSEEESK